MINNTSCTPFIEGLESPSIFGHKEREEWENYIQFDSEKTFNPPSPEQSYSEILFEKPKDPLEQMDVEETIPDFEDIELWKLVDESSHDPSHKRQEGIKNHNEHEDRVENETSECSRCNSEEEEEDVGSISTRDTRFGEATVYGSDMLSCAWDDNFSVDQNFELEAEIKSQTLNIIQSWPDEEKQYINQVMPHLVSSLKELVSFHKIPLNEKILGSMLRELLYGKEIMLGKERQMMRKIVEKEMLEQRSWRPQKMVTENDLVLQKRKDKKAMKGNRNSSNMNHLNENYVSNIFQFARRAYPYDKEVQKIANERNVSASNFRSLMAPRLTDNIMARKAKERIIGSGKELIGNIEYWMKDGYFEQCNDREKYIWHKEKALRDLALTGQY